MLLSSFIHGTAHPELRKNPTFIVHFPYGGEVVVHVNSVSTSSVVLEIYGNDTLVEKEALPDRDGKNDAYVKEYDVDITAFFPAGTHEIRLDNSSGDRLSIDYIMFTRAVLKCAKTRVMGLGNGAFAIVWIQNRDHTWWNVVKGMPIEPVEEAKVVLYGFKEGDYVVE